jgi:hypothetical protein
MKRASTCPHRNVQQFTETCLDCGRNIYETPAEYEKYLAEELAKKRTGEAREAQQSRIRALEDALGMEE